MLKLSLAALASVALAADYDYTITVEGRSRRYLLHVPDSYTGSEAIPLVVDIHGYTSSPESQRGLSGFYELSDEEGFAVAYPQGEGYNNFLRGFAGSAEQIDPGCCGQPAVEYWDDVLLIQMIKEHAAQQFNLDLDKVYITGLSNGSYLSHRILVENPGIATAYGPTGAALSQPFADMAEGLQPKPMYYMHGIRDTVQPINGSLVAGEQILSLEETMEVYGKRNGCDEGPGTVTLSRGQTTCYQKTGCAVATAYCAVNGPHSTYLNSDLNMAREWYDWWKSL